MTTPGRMSAKPDERPGQRVLTVAAGLLGARLRRDVVLVERADDADGPAHLVDVDPAALALLEVRLEARVLGGVELAEQVVGDELDELAAAHDPGRDGGDNMTGSGIAGIRLSLATGACVTRRAQIIPRSLPR